jgi:hypothetical protein
MSDLEGEAMLVLAKFVKRDGHSGQFTLATFTRNLKPATESQVGLTEEQSRRC